MTSEIKVYFICNGLLNIVVFYYFYSNLQFWLLNAAFTLPNTAYNCWIALISITFRSLDVGEVSILSS